MELLNLDELVEIERYVTLRGKRYAVAERSVGQMLNSILMVKKNAISSEEDFLVNMARTVKAVLPDVPEDVIQSMSLRQMVALLEFVNKDPNTIASEAAQEAAALGKTGEVESEVVLAGEA